MRLFKKKEKKTKDTVEISLVRLNVMESELNNALLMAQNIHQYSSVGRMDHNVSDKDWDIYTEITDDAISEQHWIRYALDHIRYVKEGKGS